MDDLADGRVGHSVLRNNLVTTSGQAYTSTKPGGTGMIRFATMTVLLLTGTAVLAQDRDLAVTIYSGDLALVQDTRSMAIGQGRQKLEFPDVSAQIRPETVQLTAADTGIVEQNFDFDQIGRAHVRTPVTNAQLVCPLLL